MIALLPSAASADIRVGMSTSLSGLAGNMGQSVKEGVEAHFNVVNAQGGVRGQPLRLITLDDAYVAERAGRNTRQLIDQENVLAIVGNVGTPTANVTVPIMNEKKTLLFGAYTGAGVLRKKPPDPYIYNYRPGYTEEIAGLVQGLLSVGIQPEEMAFFTQDGSYGDSGFASALEVFDAVGFKGGRDLPHGRYRQGQVNVEDALLALLDAPMEPRAIMMIGTARPGAKFVKIAKEDFPKALFLGVSPMANQGFIDLAGEAAEGVIFAQVVPHYSSGLPLIQEYRDAYRALTGSKNYSANSLEGFVVGKIFTRALQQVRGELTRQAITDAIGRMGRFDIGLGIELELSPQRHQASDHVWPNVVRDGRFQAMNWASLSSQ